jgi:hypothetical protein
MRRLSQLGLLIVAIVCPFFRSSAGQTVRVVDAGKYYKLEKLSVGRLVISNLRVQYAVPKPQPERNGLEDVPTFNLSKGHVVLLGMRDGAKVEILAGDLSEGTGENPAGAMAGKFEWADSRTLKSVELSSLRLRLKNVKLDWKLGGASPTISPTSELFLENESLALSSAAGVLRLSVFGSIFRSVAINWQGIPMKVDAIAGASEATVLNLDIRDGEPFVVAARLRVPQFTT